MILCFDSTLSWDSLLALAAILLSSWALVRQFVSPAKLDVLQLKDSYKGPSDYEIKTPFYLNNIGDATAVILEVNCQWLEVVGERVNSWIDNKKGLITLKPGETTDFEVVAKLTEELANKQPRTANSQLKIVFRNGRGKTVSLTMNIEFSVVI